MEAQGSWLTNKYAEGLPGKRYYGGCEFVDVAENLARDRALRLFPGAEHVNVQPHSGAQANMAAYFSVIDPGDRILGMKLDQGGHLTHGMKLNFSRPPVRGPRLRRPRGHRADRLRRARGAGRRGPPEADRRRARPPIPRTWDFERMAAIAHGVGALLFVDMAHVAGLVAAGVHPSPFPHADIVTTTTHKTLRGPRGGMIFSRFELPTAGRRRRLPERQGRTLGTRARGDDRPDRLPGRPGRPAMQVIAGKAVAFQLALGEEFRRDQQRTIDNAATIAAASPSADSGSSPAAPTTTSCSST